MEEPSSGKPTTHPPFTLITRFFHEKFRLSQQVLISLVLIGLTLGLFWPVSDFGFVDYDDPLFVSNNPEIRNGLTRDSVKWALTADLFSDSPNADFWIPLTFLSHVFVVEIFGLNPSGHHLLNLLLHAGNTLLLFFVFKKMTRSLWPSAFVAALFAIHPIHVESVAWVSERKDVLSGFFFLLVLWTYLRYIESPGIKRYLPVLLAFALGLLSKPILVTMPFVLLLLDYWPLGRVLSPGTRGRRQVNEVMSRVWEKAPLFLLSGASVAITYLSVYRGGFITGLDTLPLEVRLSNALVAYAAYLGKIFWPTGLAVIYIHPGNNFPLWKIMGSAMLLLGVFFFAFRWRRAHPYIIVGWLWFLGTLVPVLGLVQAGIQSLADRYVYIPLIGIGIIAAWGMTDLAASWKHGKVFLAVCAGCVLIPLMILAGLQVQTWRSSETLFRHAQEVTEKNYIAHNNLGVFYNNGNRWREASIEFQAAIEANPSYSTAYHNLGRSLNHLGRREEALQSFQKAISLQPEFPAAYNSVGLFHFEEGRHEEALAAFDRALDLKPDYVSPLNNKGLVYHKMGDSLAAIEAYQAAIKLDPGAQTPRFNLAREYAVLGKYSEAAEEYRVGLERDPLNATAQYNLGLVLKRLGRPEEAQIKFDEALRLNPGIGSGK